MSELPDSLKKLVDEFQSMQKESSELFRKITDKSFNNRPESGGWSAAECIDHLIATGMDYCDQYEKALKQVIENNKKLTGELKYSWFGQRFINFVEPPARFKVKAPKRWQPDSNINLNKAGTAYLQLQERYIDLINSTAGWDISTVKLPSPATKLIKFSGLEMLAINSAHQRRHFLQAKKALNIK
jgi:hypothetical protein